MPDTQVHDSRSSKAKKRRKKIVEAAFNRIDGDPNAPSDEDFTKHLSGGTTGPYGGLRILQPTGTHINNGDETTHETTFEGSFSKGLKHDPATGLVSNPQDFIDFRTALNSFVSTSSFPGDALIREIENLSPGFSKSSRKLVNPIAGSATDVTGLDPLSAAIPPAPELSSEVAAIEVVDLYWMALLRDVPFHDFGNNQLFGDAVAELNTLNQTARGNGKPYAQTYRADGLSTIVDALTAFRGSAPGNDAGSYLSQFLLQDVPYGTMDFQQKQNRLKLNNDYMMSRQSWLDIQNGANPPASRENLEDTSLPRRHITTFRELAHYVHFDALHEAYFNAALILMGLGAKKSAVNPYEQPDIKRQEGFGTFGGPHLLVAVTEVASRALKAIWHQKWLVHRRLRPEVMGGRIEFGQATNIHAALLNSEALSRSQSLNGNSLLPMAFPEGSPMHPSYGAGHATVAGACTTILKAFFATNERMPKTVKALDDGYGGTRLEPTNEPLTIGGELNKLAGNISIGRNGAGVHYRTDYTASMALGEAVATAMLQEQAMTLREGLAKTKIAWEFENFAGDVVKVRYDGVLESTVGSATLLLASANAGSYSCTS